MNKFLAECQNKTDEDIVEMVLNDQNYFLGLIDRYENKLLRYILRISSFSYEEAEDTLQEVFINAYRNLNNFDHKLKFSSWIYRIAHNQVISSWRKKQARPQNITWEDVNEGLLKNLIADLDLEKEIDSEYLKESIQKVFDGMDNKYREVLVLKFLEEKNYNEISDILKKPMGTVATLINRAKKQFQKEVEKHNIKF